MAKKDKAAKVKVADKPAGTPEVAGNTAAGTSAGHTAAGTSSQPKAPAATPTVSQPQASSTEVTPETPAITPGVVSYAEAEARFNNKVGEHQVKVSKTVDLVDESKPIIWENVEHTVDGKKSHTHESTTVLDVYSVVSGHETTTRTSSQDYTYYDKDKTKLKTMVEKRGTGVDDASDGTFDVVANKTEPYSTKAENITTTMYNKDGSVKAHASHNENIARNGVSVSDSYKEYTGYTDDEHGTLRRELRADATTTQLIIKALDNKKKKEFNADRTIDGNEHYTITQKKKGMEIFVKGGIASGVARKYDKSGVVTLEEKQLSQKQLRKALKDMRHEADNTVARVSSAKTAEEYWAAIPSPLQMAPRDLSFPFVNTEAARQQVEPEIQARQQKTFTEKASVTAEQILQREIKQH